MLIFDIPDTVKKTLNSSRRAKSKSLWTTYSIKARPLSKTGAIAKQFSTQLVPRLASQLGLHGQPSGSETIASDQGQSKHSTKKSNACPAKRPRTEDWGTVHHGAFMLPCMQVLVDTIVNTRADSNTTLWSPEWMWARITQLEAELDETKAARDMALSEQDVVRIARQAEQNARREAMAQKSAAEASLARKEAEYSRLRAELEEALSRESVLLSDVKMLRGDLAKAEEGLRTAQSSLDESQKTSEQIKFLKQELEEARDRAHKLQLQKLYLEEQQSRSDAAEFEDAREKIQKLKAEVKRSNSELASTLEKLESTQRALEAKERKCSSTRGKYERIKEKLGAHKARLENERTLIGKLRDTLTPEAYRSLGATHETLGAFPSAMGSPLAVEEGNDTHKEESD
ncbi:unnamed protein product [Rhizoctonia solani]|uniref:Uncharacterized protein n=1 Tax=Rhizoctonia solani TaxID=456999 RepID=A0A8H3BJI3_9AGAM|nr:unnamed protein product [Rhizoctonia solani]